jgi:hypothetical protein
MVHAHASRVFEVSFPGPTSVGHHASAKYRPWGHMMPANASSLESVWISMNVPPRTVGVATNAKDGFAGAPGARSVFHASRPHATASQRTARGPALSRRAAVAAHTCDENTGESGNSA